MRGVRYTNRWRSILDLWFFAIFSRMLQNCAGLLRSPRLSSRPWAYENDLFVASDFMTLFSWLYFNRHLHRFSKRWLGSEIHEWILLFVKPRLKRRANREACTRIVFSSSWSYDDLCDGIEDFVVLVRERRTGLLLQSWMVILPVSRIGNWVYCFD